VLGVGVVVVGERVGVGIEKGTGVDIYDFQNKQ
jgi:hypothetical protein